MKLSMQQWLSQKPSPSMVNGKSSVPVEALRSSEEPLASSATASANKENTEAETIHLPGK